MRLVQAKSRGFYAGMIREAGDQFYVPPHVNGRWFFDVVIAQEAQPDAEASGEPRRRGRQRLNALGGENEQAD